MNVNEISTLVDHKSIADWKASFEALNAARIEADSRLADAQKAAKAAHKASEAALAGRGALSVEDAEDGIEAAERTLRIATKVADAATKKFNRERDRQHIVTGIAHRGVWAEGVRQRLAAAKAGDAAKKALADAEKAYADAHELMNYAAQNHCAAIGRNEHGQVALKTEAEERAHFAANRIDPDAPVSWWQPE